MHRNVPAETVNVIVKISSLDGLPLAIVLAAARSKLFPPQAPLLRLRQRLPLLTSSTRDVPARQQTLRSTIGWSHHLLAPDEQGLFRRLSVFVGGCTLEAAESVSAALEDAIPPVLDRVASLLDKNLLLQTDQEGEEPRLTMLETIRAYGLECLTTKRERAVTQEAHAAYYLQLAETATVELIGPQQAVWYQRLEDEQDNLRAAMQYLLEREEGERALRLCSAPVVRGEPDACQRDQR
jgi:predicted ATPase